MKTVETAQRAREPEVDDPYRLDPADVQEPPTSLRGTLRRLGPGMILSAAVVGSGELITTTALGAQAGFALLWLVIISALVKVWVQIELGRWTILTGRTALAGYAQVGPRIGRVGAINWLWILMDFAKMLQRGGIIGGTAAAFSILFPIGGEALGTTSLTVWTVIVVVSAVALMYSGRYGLVERAAFIAVVLFTLITVGLALSLPGSGFSYSGSDLLGGLSFAIPAGSLGFAVAMFGITGVGADEMTTYTYWCLEKGYARWTGPDDGTEERARRAEGWIRVMRIDALIAWGVCTVCTLSFYIIGAAILHPQDLVPKGNEMITTLSRLYTDTLGEWSHYFFLVGAIAVLYSTLIGSTASVPRLWTNTLGLLGVIDWNDPRVRRRTVRALTVALPPLWGASYLWIQSPVLMVQIGGIAGGIFLVAVVIAAWTLRYQDVPHRFRRSRKLTTALVLSSVAIGALGIYSILEVLGLGIGG
ncbi:MULTISPECIES: Nramp family divalent metal transporter [Streptomyces]|jgi:Mn2+/Fe2+ NRAMP family transporter|uniref:Nramp family divalent metal transporter n=1 Tax=Streptomyces TaxID=1883 RepID=UPI0019041EDD|nr:MULTISPECIES: Nramp family divalent metal transporter [unclassified Streptomyces]MCU4747984.1 Nramp family divalent metal transporter [Streptomyces sp. G-5]QQN78597.1 Nramp family divalent metal transporter [Streptomyces sp. XC 2026]